jgi:hypothetical protein
MQMELMDEEYVGWISVKKLLKGRGVIVVGLLESGVECVLLICGK